MSVIFYVWLVVPITLLIYLFYNLICLIVIEFKLHKIKKELQKAQKDLEESIAECERLVGEDK